MSPDLRIATAYVRPLLEGQNEAALKLLAEAAGAISAASWRLRLDMKFMPEIRFRIDTALDYAEKIDRLLQDPAVARDLAREEVNESRKYSRLDRPRQARGHGLDPGRGAR